MRFLAALLILALVSVSASASDSVTVAANGGTAQITGPDGVCRVVTNNKNASEYVPTSRADEWQNFLVHLPSTTTATTCSCTGTPWGTVAEGYSNTAYSTSQVACGSSCSSVAQTRTCTNGTMSGSYTITSCSVASCDPCLGSPAVGTVCADGSLYAGLSPDGNVKMYTTRCDAGQTWSGSACTGTASPIAWEDNSSPEDITAVANCTSAASCNAYGKANSAAIVAQRGSWAAAAFFCESLTVDGKSDWYLPALSELNVLYTNKAAIGNFNTSGTYYWSSSEYSYKYAWAERFSDGLQYYAGKYSYLFPVRCVRR